MRNLANVPPFNSQIIAMNLPKNCQQKDPETNLGPHLGKIITCFFIKVYLLYTLNVPP